MKFEKKVPKGRHKLPEKKTLVVAVSKAHPNMFRIHYKEGGVVPNALSGQYTSKRAALHSITAYELKTHTYLKHVRDKEHAENNDKD